MPSQQAQGPGISKNASDPVLQPCQQLVPAQASETFPKYNIFRSITIHLKKKEE